MRIGIDATTIYTARPTGLGIYSINVINEISKLHDDIVVWTIDDSLLHLPSQKIRRVMQPLRRLGDQLFQLRPLWVEFILPRLIREEGIDVLLSTIPNGLTRSPVPHVVTVHDLIPLVFPDDAPRTVRWNFRYRLPKIFDNSAAIVAVSEHTQADLLNNYSIDKEKIRVVSEGYDKDNFYVPDDLSPLEKYNLKPFSYVFYVGNSSPRKNLSKLIEAFSLISGLIPQDLVLAGSKNQKQTQQLKECASKYGVQDRVKLLDYVPYVDLKVLYHGAAVFAFLSLYEGFGLPALEAMACGAAVLLADTTSLPEVGGDATLLVNPLSAREIANCLYEALTNDRLQARLRENAVLRSSTFSWECTARNLLKLLEQCAKFVG